MRFSHFFAHTKRSAAAQDSVNAYLLDKAGYVSQVAAGVYAMLPLGLRSIQKIEQIVREEMNAIGASELSLSALQLKSTWEKAGRWADPNFREILYYDQDADMALAPTHEEPMTGLVKEAVQSYRDLPVLTYQFQTKFRKELRAKSGLLRGREFRMKDLYSFHPDEASHNDFYEVCAAAYLKIFERMGLDAYRTKASGGIFTDKFSDEFQVICPTGEDEILVDHKTKTGFNQEVEDQVPAAKKGKLERVKAIEVGNIFPLETKYSKAFDLQFLDEKGERHYPIMGAYGIGISRLLGTLAEIYNDDSGLKLPRAVAPFDIYLIDLTEGKMGVELHDKLEKAGYEVLLDDRAKGAGEKMIDADLIGCPIRLVYSPKTAENGEIELKVRATGEVKRIKLDDLLPVLGKSLL
ncbi:MAG TPA: aminoacyl--tRNA ligase-related protein [Candidatus Saccharimonadales bacterium]|nr:aminoacyl--tRNA ligase-related protein [Candidatus Saccharimonadales bacterium]